MPTLQVTIGSTGKTQISPHGIGYRQIVVQANGSNAVRYGDSTIVAGAYGTGKGMLIASGGGNFNSGPSNIQVGVLSDKYVAGTVGDVVDIDYSGA